MRLASKANIVSGTEEQPQIGTPRPKPPRRLGLAGKLLLLTIPLVMIAEVLIYPSGAVPDSLARQILRSIGARAVAIKMGQQRRLLASADLPPAIDHDIDMRSMTVWSAIVGSFGTSGQALVAALSGAVRPQGRLPFQLPRSMQAVRASRPDVPSDTPDPLFPAGHGLHW